MRGAFQGYLFGGFSRIAIQLPYIAIPFGLGTYKSNHRHLNSFIPSSLIHNTHLSQNEISTQTLTPFTLRIRRLHLCQTRWGLEQLQGRPPCIDGSWGWTSLKKIPSPSPLYFFSFITTSILFLATYLEVPASTFVCSITECINQIRL